MNVVEDLLGVGPEAPFIVERGRVTSYGWLQEASGRLARSLAGAGVRPDDRVALVMGNGRAHVLAYAAVLRAGAVPVSIDPTASAPELAGVLAVARPRAVIAGPAVVAKLPPDGPLLFGEEPGAGITSLDDLVAAAPEPLPPVARRPGDAAAVLFTSGSTGRPKGVVLTHGNVRFVAGAQASVMPGGPGSVTALGVPLHHCYGQNAVLNATIRAGGAVALLDARRKRWLVDDLREFGVTGVPSVPATFQLLLDLGASATTLPLLRYAVSAAATLPAAVDEEWRRRFPFAVHEGYGLTETSPCALYNDRTTAPAGALGRPFPGVRARVVDGAGQEVPDGTVGILELAGPNVMAGYLGSPEETAAVLRDGWLTTGDYVRRDPGGDYAMVGRAKSVIVVSGSKVFPAEVESALGDVPGVGAIAVVGRPHSVMGEMVTAFVEAGPGVGWDELAAALRERSRERLAPYKRPRAFRSLTSLPRLASGKPDVQELRRLAAEPADRPGSVTPAG